MLPSTVGFVSPGMDRCNKLSAGPLSSQTATESWAREGRPTTPRCRLSTSSNVPSRLCRRTRSLKTPYVAASAGPPSPKVSPLQEVTLGEFAWVHGGRPFPLPHQPCTRNVFCFCPSCTTSLPSHASTHSHGTEAHSAWTSEEVATVPAISLASHIRDTFKETEKCCYAELARFGVDKDADVVHGLHVVLHRFRSMLRLFTPFLDVDKKPVLRDVTHILKALGPVRDCGAMVETLDKVKARIASAADAANPGGRRAEAGSLGSEDKAVSAAQHLLSDSDPGRMLTVLEGLREELLQLEQQQLAAACKQLKGKHSRSLFSTLQTWAEGPCLHGPGRRWRHGTSAEASQDLAVIETPLPLLSPAVLSPYVSSLLLHPGWKLDDIWGMTDRGSPQLDVHLCKTARDLRKQLRELGYAMELLLPAYALPHQLASSSSSSSRMPSRRFKEALAKVKELQQALGQLKDLQALSEFLVSIAGRNASQQRQMLKGKKVHRAKKAEAAARLADESAAVGDLNGVIMRMQEEVWAQWLVVRETINSSEGRTRLYLAMVLESEQPSREVQEVQGSQDESVKEETMGTREEKIEEKQVTMKFPTPADAAAAAKAALEAEAAQALLPKIAQTQRRQMKPARVPAAAAAVAAAGGGTGGSGVGMAQRRSAKLSSAPLLPKRHIPRGICRLWSSRDLSMLRSGPVLAAASLSPSHTRTATLPYTSSEVLAGHDSKPEDFDSSGSQSDSEGVAAGEEVGSVGGSEMLSDMGGVFKSPWDRDSEVLPQNLLPDTFAEILALQHPGSKLSESPSLASSLDIGMANRSLFKQRIGSAQLTAAVVVSKTQEERMRTDIKG